MTKLFKLRTLLFNQEEELKHISNFKQYLNTRYRIKQLKIMIKQEEDINRAKFEEYRTSILNSKSLL